MAEMREHELEREREQQVQLSNHRRHLLHDHNLVVTPNTCRADLRRAQARTAKCERLAVRDAGRRVERRASEAAAAEAAAGARLSRV